MHLVDDPPTLHQYCIIFVPISSHLHVLYIMIRIGALFVFKYKNFCYFIRGLTHIPPPPPPPPLTTIREEFVTHIYLTREIVKCFSKFNLKVKISPFWACEFVHVISHHKLKSVFPNLEEKCILALLRSLLIWGLIDHDLQFHFWFQTCYFLPNFASLTHFHRLYISNEAIASECSTSHMAPHIYWFLCETVYFNILVRSLEFSQHRLSDWHWILQAAIDFRHIIYVSHVQILYANINQSPKHQ